MSSLSAQVESALGVLAAALAGHDGALTLAHALQGQPDAQKWLALSVEMDRLVGDGVWQPDERARDAVRTLNAAFGAVPDIALAVGQLGADDRLEQIEFATLLHTLATRPDKVLPPGKSILSVLARSREPAHAENPMATRIADMMTRAFFDAAAEALASQDTAAQLARLQLLYTDLLSAFTDVLPPVLPQMHTLATPIVPDAALPPLEKARRDLRALLDAVCQRCARVRDATVDALAQSLANAPSDDRIVLAKTVSDVVRGLLKLAENMQSDMLSFAAARWREEDVRRWLREEAVINERHTILSLWPADITKSLWVDWISGVSDIPPESSQLQRWVTRLSTAVGGSLPIQPPALPSEPNTSTPGRHILPPHFAFCITDLVRIQNLVQALVITAALHALVPSSPSLCSRVWTLLSAEADADLFARAQTTLPDLVAEVRRAAPADADGEQLQGAVERILRYEDPVFVLLQKRVLDALRFAVVPAVERYRARGAPLRLLTGRGHQRSRSTADDGFAVQLGAVKGFEDEALKEGLKSCAQDFGTIVRWIVDVWGNDVL